MRGAVRQILICAAALMLICGLGRLGMRNTFTVDIPLSVTRDSQQEELSLVFEDPSLVRSAEAVTNTRDGRLRVRIRPDHPGETALDVVNEDGETITTHSLRVTPLMTVYDRATGGFTGDTAVLIAFTAFCLTVSAIMLWNFFQVKGSAFYAYITIYFAGFSIFTLVTGLLMAQVTAAHLINPVQYSMSSAYATINSASANFLLVTTPLFLLFAIAMAVSNIALLRHERPSLQNALGLMVSALLIVGDLFFLWFTGRDFSGSELEARLDLTFKNTCATVFVYFECMLAGSVICGVRASRRVPDPDKDCIIILGCWFRPDGTLPPLLRGRVDKALQFWREQKERTGREAVFIPSGGKGRNEPMPEAEAMRRYLLEQGVPDRLILPETRSANTYQNMAYSRELIGERFPEARVMYATTSYHVFRSGVWAARAGLTAEGIGSRTRWWYWPNAFMREVLGLLRNRWKEEALLLASLIIFFGSLSMTLM